MDEGYYSCSDKPNWRGLLGPMLLGAALLIILSARYWKFTVDDAYISLRYAQNLVRGNGLVYNLGERVEGFSNLTWTLLSAGALELGLDPIPTLKIVGIICALLVIWTSLLILARIEPEQLGFAWVVAFLVGAAPCVVAWSLAGMETMLFALMLSLTFYTYVSNKEIVGWPVWPLMALLSTQRFVFRQGVTSIVESCGHVCCAIRFVPSLAVCVLRRHTT